MKTLMAFWRYDWNRNGARHLALAAMAAVWPWAMQFGQSGFRDGQLWAPVLLAIGMASGLAIPLLLVGNAIETGRMGSPHEFRHFVHTLPVDRTEWALAKLVDALVWVVMVPLGLIVVAVLFAKLVDGAPFGIAAAFPSLVLTLATFSVWTMLWAALFPHRWVLVGIPVFVLGECWARGVTSLGNPDTGVARTLFASGLDMGLLAVLGVVLAVVFVVYHQRRKCWWALAAALFALVGIDGLRALVCWWIPARL